MNTHHPDIAFFHQLANRAAQETLPRFLPGHTLSVDTKIKKGVSFDPVTDADRQAEVALREMISAAYPQHSILGEEFGLTGEGDYQWILDPVDGTRPFMLGLPVWGTLVGLICRGTPVMGMMSQPYTGERFWADGERSWHSSPHGTYVMKTRKNITLANAILHTNSPEPMPRFPEIRLTDLMEKVLMTRFGGECYAMAMVAAGKIDLCFDYALQPYDIAAFIPIIEQAGGCVTTLDGGPAIQGGAVLASGCPRLHQQVLTILNKNI
ncbi:TPA: inositol monophosphatase family protein [Morganella morganii]